ncbi:DUF4328 domain-containing protein [Terrabacter sp. LjRoot27]|uniref:DUF4328 domain-containing protein n=1 Tax=Terrabacter sp. LjRoot27 TaxID=3342306 RepID=UPI003ED06267
MTQPAAPHEPTAAPEAATVPPAPAGPPVPVAPPAATAQLPAPTGQPVATGQPGVSQPGVTANFKNINVRPWRQSTAVVAIIAQALFVLAALANLYLTSLDVKVKGLLSDRDFAAMEREAEGAQSLYWLILGVGALAAVFLLVWFHRVWTSDRSDHSLYTRGTGLAIGGWFIPIANIVLGPLALRDLMWGTEHASPTAKPGRPNGTPRLVIALWVLIFLNVLLVMAGRSADTKVKQADSLSELMDAVQSSLTFEAVGGLAGAAGAVIGILYIRRVMAYTRR